MKFRFKALQDKGLIEDTKRLLDGEADDYKMNARVRGSLLTLFGEPVKQSWNYVEAYEYIIEAATAEGEKYLLTAYQGHYGASIGARNNTAQSKEAAEELMRVILQTEPADYEVICYLEDYELKITSGCKAGEIYVQKDTKELAPDEVKNRKDE